MMILSAVILLIGFIALAGMVSRVSQLGSQTTIESEQAILGEVGPLADSMNMAICRLKESTDSRTLIGNAVTDDGSPVVTFLTNPNPAFSAADIGMVVSGTGILPSSRIVAVTATSITLTEAATADSPPAGTQIRFISCLPPGATTTFDLGLATSPTLDEAVTNVLEHLQALEASHGLFMDWTIGCFDLDGDNNDPVTNPDPDDIAAGQVTAHLWDGTVWLEVKSSVMFQRSTCTSITG